jgi:hypothetical protein
MVEEKRKQEGEDQVRQRQLVPTLGMDVGKCWWGDLQALRVAEERVKYNCIKK